jgi:cytochrome c
MVSRANDNLRIVSPAKAEGRLAGPERQRLAQGKETEMKFKYAAMVATLALIAPVASALAADGDPAAGEATFKQKCAVCHKIGEGAKNFVGPELNGIVGRKAGAAEGYAYSDGVKNAGWTWDSEKLHTWLTDPKATVPGTKMIFAGLPKESDRDNVVAYLAQFKADGTK